MSRRRSQRRNVREDRCEAGVAHADAQVGARVCGGVGSTVNVACEELAATLDSGGGVGGAGVGARSGARRS